MISVVPVIPYLLKSMVAIFHNLFSDRSPPEAGAARPVEGYFSYPYHTRRGG